MLTKQLFLDAAFLFADWLFWFNRLGLFRLFPLDFLSPICVDLVEVETI